MPDLFNPDEGTQMGTENTWLSLLTKSSPGRNPIFRGRVGNYGIAKQEADMVCGSFLGLPINLFEQGLTNPYNQLHGSEAGVQQRSDKFLSRIFGTSSGSPLSISTLVQSDFMRLSTETENDSVDLPGVELTGLTLTVREDAGERLQRAANRAFEQNLKNGTNLASAFLPAQFGGELENVLALVDRLIEQFTAAGIELNNAPYFQALARTELANGHYRTAYTRTRQAYQLLTRDP
jgi:hypothetical protein